LSERHVRKGGQNSDRLAVFGLQWEEREGKKLITFQRAGVTGGGAIAIVVSTNEYGKMLGAVTEGFMKEKRFPDHHTKKSERKESQ